MDLPVLTHSHDPVAVRIHQKVTPFGGKLNKPFLSVVIPAYNEGQRIRDNLLKITAYLDTLNYPAEIIVIDDGSADRTAEQVEQIKKGNPMLSLLRSESNRGKGHAVRKGMLASLGGFSLLTDADLSTPIRELDKFIPHMDSPDTVLVGNRKIAGARITRHQHIIRESMGKVFTLAGNAILGMRQGDFTCGFKIFGERARKSIFGVQKINGWAYDAEILFLARKFGFPVKDIPVVWEDYDDTKVRLMAASVASFSDLFRIRWYQITGQYRRVTQR
jgi:dolichyl-phosphate beta-glucosyltransferase